MTITSIVLNRFMWLALCCFRLSLKTILSSERCLVPFRNTLLLSVNCHDLSVSIRCWRYQNLSRTSPADQIMHRIYRYFLICYFDLYTQRDCLIFFTYCIYELFFDGHPIHAVGLLKFLHLMAFPNQ